LVKTISNMKRNESTLVRVSENGKSNFVKRGFKYFALLVMALVVINVTHAQVSQDQPPPDESSTNDGGPTGPGGPGDPDVPIDGGISLLIAAGIGYGLKKKYDVNKKADKE
jgi:hypothetical protein